jgi:hypothetical protein
MNDALLSLYDGKPSNDIAKRFIEQMDAYYASPSSSFHDNNIARRFYQQRLDNLRFKPYPNDGLVTFGASGTNKCDREIIYKNAKIKTEKSDDLPSHGRQRRIGSAVIEYFQLDLVHMQKRLGDKALFTVAETDSGEYAFEEAAQVRKVFEHNGVKFAIIAKPDGLLNYENKKLLFEFKTKATGIIEMNSKLDYNGAQDDHLQQVTAESLLFGVREGLIVYESTQKPSWFSDEEKKNVPKTRKTWRDGKPIADLRAEYFYITDEMQTKLLDNLARQAGLVYNGEVPEITFDMTQQCGFCPFTSHCKATLTEAEKTKLRQIDTKMSSSHMAGKYQHNNLVEYLKGVDIDG